MIITDEGKIILGSIINFILSINAIWFILSALITWFIAHTYYKKSMSQQESASSREISELIEVVRMSGMEANGMIKHERLNDAIKEYKIRGTPVRVIDSYDDLSDEEKAEMYDAVMLRVKGRLGKSNKYRRD